MSDRLLIIGWDGADWDIIENLMERGLLPNVSEMVESGAWGALRSTIPSHSWAAWSSFLTGMHPTGHGVFDFVERDALDPQRRVPVSSHSIQAVTFLERASEAGHQVRCANVPVTFPPIPIAGRMISGVAIPRRASFVYPPDWAAELHRKARFPVNGMEWSRFRASPLALIEEAERFVEERTRSFELLLEGEWTIGVCVYVAPDRLQHPFGAYLLPSHPDYDRRSRTELAERVRAVYRRLDAALGRLRRVSGRDATVVLMSDHGFRPITRVVNLNVVLAQVGLAGQTASASAVRALRGSVLARLAARTKLGKGLKARFRSPSVLDWSKTVAYSSVTGGGISLNLRGREVAGIVDPARYAETRAEVRERLLRFSDDETGEHPIASVATREELPAGPFADKAPDLIASPSPLWGFSATHTMGAKTDWPSGAHRQAGIVAAAGGRVTKGELGEREIIDMAATALAFAGVPAEGLDGRAIEEISGRPLDEEAGAAPAVARVVTGMSSQDEDEVTQHLRDLGYIE